MADQQTSGGSGGVVSNVVNTMNDLISAQTKVIGKTFEAQSSLIDSTTKSLTAVFGTFTNKVNDALGNVWVGKK